MAQSGHPFQAGATQDWRTANPAMAEAMTDEPVPIPPGVTFTVSARGKPPRQPILAFVAEEFARMPLAQIESIFGFVEHTTLYGGRPFVAPELSPGDVQAMHDCCIGLRLPLSNHSVTREEYEQNRAFLAKYHIPGNSVITYRDDLAAWIRADFPRYEIEGSVIKEIDTLEKIEKALVVYDTIVLPMRLNLDRALLKSIPEKHRITLFANAGCALNCPAKICYGSVSKANKLKGDRPQCSVSTKARDLYGMLNFHLEPLVELGFKRFKLLRMRKHGMTGY